MTEVYQSIAQDNAVEDRYARNESARKALLGPLSLVIKCLGFDSTYSLFKSETRRRPISWIATPLLVIGMILLVANMFTKFSELDGFQTLEWKWGETLLIFFLAMHSVAAARYLIYLTAILFFVRFYDAWSECTRLAEKENKEEKNGKENGDAEMGGSVSSIPRSTATRPIFVIKAYIVFIGATIATSTKYAVNHGHNPLPNENVTAPLLDKFVNFEPLLSLWAAIISATALAIYGVLHGIMQDTIDDFNTDLQAASEKKTLAPRLDSFAVRHQAVLEFARLLSRKSYAFASYTTQPMIAVNFLAMFLSLAFEGGIGGLGYLCIVLWTFAAIGSKVCVLLQPAAVQEKLNKSCEILVADKEIWAGDLAVAQQAQIMLTKAKSTDTMVSILKCLRLTPWSANGLMFVPPLIGLILFITKKFIMNAAFVKNA